MSSILNAALAQWRRYRCLCWMLLPAYSLLACTTLPPPAFDYTALREHMPQSILVLPPVNRTLDTGASASMWAASTQPLAEAGYYVLPVAWVQATFEHNGLNAPEDIHALPHDRLQTLFGADAGLYINVTAYGTVYQIIHSVTTVSANAQLVDLTTGSVLWSGTASASSAENQSSQSSLAMLLVAAVVNQIIANVGNASHDMAHITAQRLLAPGADGSLLYGPRSPHFARPYRKIVAADATDPSTPSKLH